MAEKLHRQQAEPVDQSAGGIHGKSRLTSSTMDSKANLDSPQNPLFLGVLAAVLISSLAFLEIVVANKASITQHGAEGPGALQVSIKASIVVFDLGGLQSLAAAEP